MTASCDGIAQSKTDQASALMNAARNTGSSIGVSIVSNVLTHREQFHQSILDRSHHHRRARGCCRLSDVRPAEPVRRVAPTKDQMVGGFSSKSEVALNLSTDGQHLIFMGYLGPIDALDISNSNTPEHPLCRGQRQQRWGSPTEWGQCRRGCANPYRRNEGAGRAGPRFAAPVASFNIT
jgi:hypothetical protein